MKTVSIRLHGEENKTPLLISCDTAVEDSTHLTLRQGSAIVGKFQRSLVYGWHFVDSEVKPNAAA